MKNARTHNTEENNYNDLIGVLNAMLHRMSYSP